MPFNYYTEKEMTIIRIMDKLGNKAITRDQACQALNCSLRTVYRYQSKFSKEGPQGLIHGLKGRPSNNSPNEGKLEFLKDKIAQKRFRGFGPTLLAEKLTELYGFEINHESLRLLMIKHGYRVAKPINRIVKRQLRKRKPQYGMMLQFDGSYHDRLENGEIGCLLLAIDDATGDLVMMKFTQGESLEDVYQFWYEYMIQHGKPGSIYVDRHASYKVNAPNDQFDEEMKTRFQTGMGKLGVEVIYSKIPEGKGRVERSFGTHQDRLVKEMRLAGIKTYEEANEFINKYYLPKHNKKFAVVASHEGNYHKALSQQEQEEYARYFSKEETRKVTRNGTISYYNQRLQLPRHTILNHGTAITTKETIDHQIRLYSGQKLLSYKKLL